METTLLHPVEQVLLLKIPEAVCDRARKVRLLVLDVDGILTDGGLLYGEKGEALKRFNALDGHGLKMLMQSGIRVAIMTGRSGEITSRRCAELGIAYVFQSVRDKEAQLEQLIKELGFDQSQVAFVGDDLIDLHAMQKCGFAVSVPNAVSYIRNVAHYVTEARGGHGAVREVTDLILASQNKLAQFFHVTVKGAVTQ